MNARRCAAEGERFCSTGDELCHHLAEVQDALRVRVCAHPHAVGLEVEGLLNHVLGEELGDVRTVGIVEEIVALEEREHLAEVRDGLLLESLRVKVRWMPRA